MIGALIGIIGAVVGMVIKVATVPQKPGWGLLIIGSMLLVTGGYASLTAGKTTRVG